MLIDVVSSIRRGDAGTISYVRIVVSAANRLAVSGATAPDDVDEINVVAPQGRGRSLRLWALDGDPLGRHLLQAGALLLLAITALSGPAKQILPGLPVDLTLVATVSAVVAGAAHAVLSGRWPSSRQLAILGLLLLIALAGATTVVSTDFGQLKVERLFTVTFVAVVAAVLPIRHHRDMVRFLWYLAGVSLVMVVWIGLTGQNQYGAGGRLTTEEGSTIPFGRASGYVVVVVLAWLLTSNRLTVPRLAAGGATIGVAVWTMIAIASRGPIQAVAFAIAAMVGIQILGMRTRTMWRAGMAFLALGVGLWAVWETIPIRSRERVTEASGGSSADAREYAFRVTWEAMDVSAIGSGWGSFARLRAAEGLTYPHNLFLEIWFEAGIVGLVAVLLMVSATVRHQVRLFPVDRPAATMSVAAAVYWLASAMVSGDVNDNKAMWMVFAALAATVAPAVSTGRSTELSPPQPPTERSVGDRVHEGEQDGGLRPIPGVDERLSGSRL